MKLSVNSKNKLISVSYAQMLCNERKERFKQAFF